MLSSRYIAEAIPAELWDRYSAIESEMIMAFARRARDADFTAMWYAQKLQAMGILREDLERIIAATWPGTRQELSKVMQQAGFKFLTQDEAAYRRGVAAGVLKTAPPIDESIPLRVLLQAGYGRAINRLNIVNATAINTTLDLLDEAYTMAATGFYTLQQSVDHAVTDLATRGVTGARFPSGRRMELAPYVRMVVRTEVMKTTHELGFERAREFGSDLIRVTAHAGARPLCAPYQGRVYSISGTHEKYPAFSSTSYGEIAGLFGINCGHYAFPFIEGVDEDPDPESFDPAQMHLDKSNKDVYEQSQEQRYNERKIREWKQRAAAMDAAGVDSKKARDKVRYWQGRQRKFLEDTGRTRRYDREKAGAINISMPGTPQDANAILSQALNAVKARGLPVPSTARVDAGAFTNAKRSPAAYRASEDAILLNPNYAGYSQLAERSRKNYLSGMWSTDNVQQVFWHEIGHSVAVKNNEGKYTTLRTVGGQPMSLNSRINNMIAKDVSYYATFSPVELVAEVFAGLMDGRTYGDKIMRIYRAYGGVWK